MGALKEAAEKLTSAKEFERGDVVIINALGDTLVALAEASVDPAEKRAYLVQGLQQGFGSALHIDRRNPDALVGSAEAEFQLGKCEAQMSIILFRDSCLFASVPSNACFGFIRAHPEYTMSSDLTFQGYLGQLLRSAWSHLLPQSGLRCKSTRSASSKSQPYVEKFEKD